MHHDILYVMALPQEGMGLLENLGIDVLYTGVGKVNATYALTKELATRRALKRLPRRVINLGTAGSRVFKTGALVACNQFVQRDMDVSPLGFEHGETPFEEGPIVLECPPAFLEMDHGICGSGDSFVTGELPVPCDIMEMEGYALAKVCLRENIPFAAVKYITDGADENAAMDWPERLRHAAESFAEFVETMQENIAA